MDRGKSETTWWRRPIPLPFRLQFGWAPVAQWAAVGFAALLVVKFLLTGTGLDR